MNFRKIEILNFLGFKERGIYYFHESHPNILFDFDKISKSDTIGKVIIDICLEHGRKEVIDNLKNLIRIKE